MSLTSFSNIFLNYSVFDFCVLRFVQRFYGVFVLDYSCHNIYISKVLIIFSFSGLVFMLKTFLFSFPRYMYDLCRSLTKIIRQRYRYGSCLSFHVLIIVVNKIFVKTTTKHTFDF